MRLNVCVWFLRYGGVFSRAALRQIIRPPHLHKAASLKGRRLFALQQ